MKASRIALGGLLALLFGCSAHTDGVGDEASNQSLRPALRRLSSAELDAAARQILGKSSAIARALPPDVRQSDYSRNVLQTVDPVMLTQLFDASRVATDAIDLNQPEFPSCARTAAVSDRDCAERTLRALGRLAFRRALTDAELSELLGLFDSGAEGENFQSGVALAVRGLLGSPKLLYATTFGADVAGRRQLSSDELATELGFVISGQPPDSELLDAAARGELVAPKNREAQAIRLLQRSDSRYLYRRFVQEWLGLIGLNGLAKSAQVESNFSTLREAMTIETNQFVDDAFQSQAGSIATLLAGSYSIVPDALAGFYGIVPTAPGARVALGRLGRVGILQQASFLATFAHESESAPVLRGKAVLTRLLCRDFPKPTELGIDIVFPAADENATTRERFDRHASDPLCRSCHATLDQVGFSFENFDAAGRLRTTESGRPLNTNGSIELDGREVTFEDSAALSRALASSPEVQACAARQVMRFAAGVSDPEVERAFVASLSHVSAARRGTFVGLFLEFVKSEWFLWRTAQ